MSDVRKSVNCDYCGTVCHMKFSEDLEPSYCPFCGEDYELEKIEEDDDGDLDYTDEERDVERYN